ncbi:mismatch-specific DNA-glycosylase [Cellulophaga baltica]|uniref:mismatch-specific DNA-glycosylase n=1 Tax=Cellulophaga baltica TaxID=76594 RepID=UPI0015F3582B|nr:mismatch-specific DNA-glycosylase [Cellulophaga baltica]MBA6316875.1 mismatch-specific DNA-glycosylase [Cellulophaga baltica]
MLKEVLTYNLNVVFCGTAKGKASARLGYYYAGTGNQFYPILYKTGLTNKLLLPSNCYDINKYKIGLTDLVHAQSGNDNQLNDENYDIISFKTKIEKYKPKYIAFNGKKSAAFALGFKGKTNKVQYGLQSQKISDTKLFILPSTSGSARRFWDE